MRVTESMTTEGGTRLSDMADFLGEDGQTGLKVGVENDYDNELTLVVDATKWPNERITFDLATAEMLAEDILAKVQAKR
jgi:hypothetical protein